MCQPTGLQRDAASTIFNLPNYRVIDAVDLPDGGRRVLVEMTDSPACPGCGVIATKVHSRRSATFTRHSGGRGGGGGVGQAALVLQREACARRTFVRVHRSGAPRSPAPRPG